VNERDGVTNKELKDEDGKKSKVAKQYWTGTLYSLYQEATQDPSKGGFAGFRDKDGNIICKQVTMEQMMPHFFSRLTDNHREDCVCTDCQNGDICHQDLWKWAGNFKKGLDDLIAEQKEWLDNNPSPISNLTEEYRIREEVKERHRDMCKLVKGFTQDSLKRAPDGKMDKIALKWDSTAEILQKELTCQSVGDTEFHPYKCCIGKCDDCPIWRLPRGMDFKKTPEWDTTGLTSIIYRVNEPGYECREHGHFTNETKKCKTKCPTCIRIPEEKPDKNPRSLQD